MFITAKIANIFTYLSAIQIYDFHIFTAVYSLLHGFIWNQHRIQLPVGFLAQLVEHCTGIAAVMGSNPVQAWIFFRPSFHYWLSSVPLKCSSFEVFLWRSLSYSRLYPQFKYMTYMTHIFTTIISTVRKKNIKKTQPFTKFPRNLRSWIFLDEDCLVCCCRYTCDLIWTMVRLLFKNANSHLCYLWGSSVKQPGFLYVLGAIRVKKVNDWIALEMQFIGRSFRTQKRITKWH